jgi:aryl-alcohol dehydrogenase-like predicted oxidoreductase
MRSRRRLLLRVLLVALSCFGKAKALSASPAHHHNNMRLIPVYNPRCLGGNNDFVVSEVCLGTMTFGVQNTLEDAHAQLDYAISKGINFIDTAEMYPVPVTAKSWNPGKTEEIIGAYIKKIGRPKRQELVLATKVSGYMAKSPIAAARSTDEIPDDCDSLPDCRLDGASVKAACDASLRRLQTDYIDLYQVHWPDRPVPLWGRTNFDYADQANRDSVSIEETASAIRDLLEAGKIRAFGLSNETPYGVNEWVRVSKELGIDDKLLSIQNSYSLLDRRFDGDNAEACYHHGVSLIAYSVLAGGLLSGKYSNTTTDDFKSILKVSSKSRFVAHPTYMRRWSPKFANERTIQASEAYTRVAAEHGMTPSELAIAFVRSRPHISTQQGGAVLIGATSLEQLEENLRTFDQEPAFGPLVNKDVVSAIDKIFLRCRDPSCSL